MGATLQAGLPLPLVALASLAACLGLGTALAVLAQRSALVRGLFERPNVTRAPWLARDGEARPGSPDLAPAWVARRSGLPRDRGSRPE